MSRKGTDINLNILFNIIAFLGRLNNTVVVDSLDAKKAFDC